MLTKIIFYIKQVGEFNPFLIIYAKNCKISCTLHSKIISISFIQ